MHGAEDHMKKDRNLIPTNITKKKKRKKKRKKERRRRSKFQTVLNCPEIEKNCLETILDGLKPSRIKSREMDFWTIWANRPFFFSFLMYFFIYILIVYFFSRNVLDNYVFLFLSKPMLP